MAKIFSAESAKSAECFVCKRIPQHDDKFKKFKRYLQEEYGLENIREWVIPRCGHKYMCIWCAQERFMVETKVHERKEWDKYSGQYYLFKYCDKQNITGCSPEVSIC